MENDLNKDDDILNIINESSDKQEVFDMFLTYRRRMARLCAVQALYLHDFRTKKQLNEINIFSSSNKNNVEEICCDVIYFYKNIFFNPQEYGWTKKNKKIDEIFMFEMVNMAVNSSREIDNFIQSRLSGSWTTEKLDRVLYAIIRCAVAEIMLKEGTEKAVLCSEYTNLAGNFFNSKEIGFINGIVDKLHTTVTRFYQPDKK